jgi:spore maturation protein CgeB
MINDSIRILWGYSYFPSRAYENSEKIDLEYIHTLQKAGFDVEGYCLTLNPPANRLTFRDMDERWKRGEKVLLDFYSRLEKRIEDFDILINASGINLHPDFVSRLPVFTVFQCFDDPESSEGLSKPVATAYDLCLVGNIAEVETYRSWGVQNAEWTPLGLLPGTYDQTLTEEQIQKSNRDIDLFMMCDKLSSWRKERMERLARAFPDGNFYGNGWPLGYLPFEKQVLYLKRARIGPNLHNSTGPINLRTFYLPANGVLQICDNRSHLGKIFELNKEVVGFETIDECIDLCRYYLAHEKERMEIAVNGWKRVIKDYNEIEVFRRKVEIIEHYREKGSVRDVDSAIALHQYHQKSIIRFFYFPVKFFANISNLIRRLRNKLRKIIRWND